MFLLKLKTLPHLKASSVVDDGEGHELLLFCIDEVHHPEQPSDRPCISETSTREIML